MNRRLGIEGARGVGGGGMVSKDSQANLEKAEDLCRKRRPNEAAPYLLKAMKDHNNLDALIQVAFLLDLPDAVEALETAESRGRDILTKSLGRNCFEDNGPHVGKFWSILETRPFMRVLQALVRVYFENRKFDKSANTAIGMLRLCPGDNTSQRTWLGSLLIRVNRHSDALFFAQNWLHPSTDKGGIPLRGGTDFHPPHRDLASPSREEQQSKWACGALLYTAALASFKLWGNCALACQYLRMAARANPSVLLRVLGRVSRPDKLNMDPRAFNGPEEAHDYLWLTQDLWMEPEVWIWANENPEAKKAVLKTCSRPGCLVTETSVKQFKRCSACRQVSYCGAPCQKEDWRKHKPACVAHKQRKDTVRAFNAGKKLPADNQMPIVATDFSGPVPFMYDGTKSP